MASSTLWALRIAWIGLPLAAGPAFADALDGASGPVQDTASIGLWAAWACGVVAVLVLRSLSLTAIRILVPASVAAAAWAAIHGPSDANDAMALGGTLATAVLALWPANADAFVDGSSYGDERRFCLREPVWVLVGGAPLAWALTVAGPVAAVLLLAAGVWWAGGVVAVVGGLVAAIAGRALHELSRRWVVFVPAGFVVHDPLVLQEPVLVPRRMVVSFGPAVEGAVDGAGDFTRGIPGLVLEAATDDDVQYGALDRTRRVSTSRSARRVRFVPVRPGAVLAEAKARRFPVAPPDAAEKQRRT